MALRECGFPFWNDAMAPRHGTSRFIRSSATQVAMPKEYEDGGQEDTGEGRVVESLGHVSVENKWCLFVPTGSLPPARAKHAALSVGRRMFVLGGASADGVLDDVQVFHAERGVWLQLGCGSAPSLYSPSRSIPIDARGPRCVGHCLAFWETKLLVVGGRIEPKSQKLKAFALDLQSQSWSILAPKGEVPVARTGQSIVQVGASLILFGGEDTKGQMLNDVFLLDLKTLNWMPQKTTGSKPSPRRSHSAVCYADRFMFVFGGKAHGNHFNDIHCLDLQTMEWTKEKPKGTIPTARAGHAGAVIGSKLYIVGGELRGNEALDTLAFDFESKSWSTITTVQPGTPLANDGLSVVKVRNRGRTFLLAFGGHGAILSNQMFVMLVSTSPHNRGRDEAEADDFSTSSLPFTFTSGSLRTIDSLLNSGKDHSSEAETEVTSKDNSQSQPSSELAVCNSAGCYSKTAKKDHHPYRQSSFATYVNGDGDEFGTKSDENDEENVLSRSELEKALRRVVMEKEISDKRLEDAVKTIQDMKREVEALVESRIEGDRRLRAAQSRVEKLEARVSLVKGDEGKEKTWEDDGDLRQQLREAQQQIIVSVRKQALAERKLLGALKENRELRKKLLHAKDEEGGGDV